MRLILLIYLLVLFFGFLLIRNEIFIARKKRLNPVQLFIFAFLPAPLIASLYCHFSFLENMLLGNYDFTKTSAKILIIFKLFIFILVSFFAIAFYLGRLFKVKDAKHYFGGISLPLFFDEDPSWVLKIARFIFYYLIIVILGSDTYILFSDFPNSVADDTKRMSISLLITGLFVLIWFKHLITFYLLLTLPRLPRIHSFKNK